MRKITIWLLFLIAAATATACGGDQNAPESLAIDPDSLTFAADGGDAEVRVSSTTGWTLSSPAEWAQISAPSGDGDESITVTVGANQAATPRSAVLEFSAGSLVRELRIEQAADSDNPPPVDSGMRDLTSVEMTELMGVGWNAGNSLDAIGGETAWGNPLLTQTLFDSVKAAGFDAVRLPVAWSRFTDEANFVIDPDWMNRVEEVVNYALDADMFVVMNIHWDGGWMQPTYSEADYVNLRLSTMWQQIATHFRDYDDRLLFAGTNEVMVEGDYGTPTEEYYTVQNGFNQTFVDTVRATGGRNAERHLVVQGFNTNIDHTVNFAVMPNDTVEDRLMMEVHYYDPYNFTLNGDSNITQWGSIATDPDATETWANESWVDQQFSRMHNNFVAQGVGVILGEYGVISRPEVEGHETYRRYWNQVITESALDYGLVPFYWDNGFTGAEGLGLFDRNTGEPVYPELIDVITDAAQ